jgi:hypothetical protein
MAEIALPYTTPRLAATTVAHRDALDDLTPEQLERFINALERATGGPVITCDSKEGAQSLGDADRNSVSSTMPALHPTLAVVS